MRTVQLHGLFIGTSSVDGIISLLLDASERIYVQTVYSDSDLYVRIAPVTIGNKSTTRKLVLERHSFLSDLADSCLSSWDEYFQDYSWDCNCTQKYLNCAKDRGEQKVHFAPINMPYDYGRYLEHSQVENQDRNFGYILVLMPIHLFSVLNASKHPLMHDMSPPKQLCWKQQVPCKLNNVTFIIMRNITWIFALAIWLRVNAGGLLNTCKSKQAPLVF